MGNSSKKMVYEASSCEMDRSSGERKDADQEEQSMEGMDGRIIKAAATSESQELSLTTEQQMDYLAELVDAIKERDIKTVRLILAKGVNLRRAFPDRQFEKTPLQCAAGNGEVEICKLLLEHGANVNQVYLDDGHSPLTVASENAYLDIVRLLLQHGADIEHCVRREYIPLGIRWELDDERDPTKVDEIIEPFQSNNSLMKSCREHHVHIVKELLNWKCQVNLQNAMGNTALHISCLSRTSHAYTSSTSCYVPARLFLGGNAEIVRLLLDRGAHVNIKNSHNETALMRAVMGPSNMSKWELGMLEKIEILENYQRIINMLLQAGADVTLKDSEGHSVVYNLLSNAEILNGIGKTEFLIGLSDIITDVVFLCSRFTSADEDWTVKYKDFFDEHPDMLVFLKTSMNSPLSLKQLSRILIRQRVHEPLKANVKKLRIPKLTQCYITLNAH